jgi:hypothetical protein
MTRPKIAVIDGQGAGIGKALIERLRATYGEKISILALGTNSLATSVMLKAGADEGATGENPVVVNAERVDVIMGAIGILAADSMLGELTPPMAQAIGKSPAWKILIPLNKCQLHVAGLKNVPFASYIDEAIATVAERYPAH